jgi:hypothetical protein
MRAVREALFSVSVGGAGGRSGVRVRLAAMAALAATGLLAQTNAADWNVVKGLAAGTEVRVSVDGRTARGTVDRVSDASVMVTSVKGQESLDRQQVLSIQVKKPGHRKRNVLIGMAVGTGAGLGTGIAARSKPGQLEIVPNGAVVAAFTAAGGLVGTLVGLVISTGGWREIYKK